MGFPTLKIPRSARGVIRVVACCLFYVGTCHLAGAAQPSPMEPRPIAAGAWYVQGLAEQGSSANQNFISNAGFVITPAGVVVVDGLGSPVLAQRMLGIIKALTDQPVTHVIVTHYHPDHIFGLQTFKAAGARIIAHGAAREYLNSDASKTRMAVSRETMAPWIDSQTEMIGADEWIEAEKTLNLGGVVFQIKPMGPAHTPEDLVVFVPEKRLLFAGDLVFRNRMPFVGQADSRRWIRALDGLLAFDASIIVPGHGPTSSQARSDLQMTRDYLVYLRRTMGEAAHNMTPFEEAYALTDWSRFQSIPMFGAVNRINAYNTYLAMEHEPLQ
jgi:glyoxylase-like metal-dependent hydrolase (beta-lactamase superfamily II)